ncbi:phage virion morphogenesis protein [Bradyrhizobium sp. 31Argb]|uniref:phage virion morphogenesis protein n=1 Tax=Bradyrhizobium sp. 31Argb TaxID=3141247 RepID=UPI0037497DBE
MRLTEQEAALAQLGGYIARAENPRGMFENIGEMLITSTHHRFDRGVSPSGGPWPPSLRVIKHGGKTLILKARLYRSLTYIASATRLEFGTNVIYAAIHQFGGLIKQAAREAVLHFKTNKKTGVSRFAKPRKADRARKAQIGERTIHMPARPFIGLDDADDRAIVKIGEDWIAGEGAGR